MYYWVTPLYLYISDILFFAVESYIWNSFVVIWDILFLVGQGKASTSIYVWLLVDETITDSHLYGWP